MKRRCCRVFGKYSCKAVREIKELADKAVKAYGSRWIPHLERALKVLLTKNYKLMVTHFQHASQARTAVLRCRAQLQIVEIS